MLWYVWHRWVVNLRHVATTHMQEICEKVILFSSIFKIKKKYKFLHIGMQTTT